MREVDPGNRHLGREEHLVAAVRRVPDRVIALRLGILWIVHRQIASAVGRDSEGDVWQNLAALLEDFWKGAFAQLAELCLILLRIGPSNLGVLLTEEVFDRYRSGGDRALQHIDDLRSHRTRGFEI